MNAPQLPGGSWHQQGQPLSWEDMYQGLDEGPMCLQVSPGTEAARMPSYCEEPPGHEGKHSGQYGETWDDNGNTNLADCIPYYNDDPALPRIGGDDR